MFSVLVPVYNVEKYVSECIDSVLRQSYVHFELILVDDGSTDNSGRICDEYAATDDRIRVIHKQNQGQIHTRSVAIREARGDYYVFLDSDDMLKDYALQTIADIIEKHHCDCVIYGYEKTQNGEIVSQTQDSEEIYLSDKQEVYKRCFFSTEMNSLCRKAVKASVFHDTDYSMYYHIKLGEDLLESLEIYKNSQSFYFTNRKLYLYRDNPQSITHQYERINVDYTVRKKTLEFIQEEGIFSSELLDKYRDFCIISVMNQIIKTCIHYSREKTKQALQAIRQDDYYQQFLVKGITDYKYVGNKSFIFCLFKKRYDDLLITLIRTIYGSNAKESQERRT